MIQRWTPKISLIWTWILMCSHPIFLFSNILANCKSGFEWGALIGAKYLHNFSVCLIGFQATAQWWIFVMVMSVWKIRREKDCNLWHTLGDWDNALYVVKWAYPIWILSIHPDAERGAGPLEEERLTLTMWTWDQTIPRPVSAFAYWTSLQDRE